MKRDMDLVRILLLKIEDMHILAGANYVIRWHDESLIIDGHEHDSVIYNFKLLYQAGFIAGEYRGGAEFPLSGLSWKGHEFLDNVRNPDVWIKTKKAMGTAGGFGLEIAQQVAKGYLKEILLHVGIPFA